jgi:hypothetical protein
MIKSGAYISVFIIILFILGYCAAILLNIDPYIGISIAYVLGLIFTYFAVKYFV